MFTYLKLGYLEFLRNLKINFLIVLEITAVLITAIFTVSSVRSQLRFYEPLSDYLDSKSLYITPDSLTTRVPVEKQLITEKQIKNKFPEAEKVCAQTSFYFTLEGEYFDVDMEGMGYPEEVINGFEPILKEGKWLSDVAEEGNVINVVVTKNDSGVKTGDEYKCRCNDENGKDIEGITVRIVGEIENGAAIFKKPNGDPKAFKADDFFANYQIDEETKNEPYLIVPQKQLDKYNIYNYIKKCAFVKLDDGVTDERFEEIKEAYILVGGAVEATEIRSNSLDVIKTNLIFLLPIVIGVLVFVIVTTVCMSAINAKKQLRSYGVYYICGSRWRQCVLISVFSAFITVIIAALLSAAALIIGDKTGLLKETVISFGSWQLTACLAVILLYLITAIIMPFAIIGRTNPREILKNED